MRFLVAASAVVDVGDEDWVPEAETKSVTFCADTREGARARRAATEAGHDWSVFEIRGGRAERRAVVLKMDGCCLYDVEIQGGAAS